VAWEIGAGLGSVTVEIALARPQVEVFALERDAKRFGFLQQNLARFSVYNVRAVRAQAPEGLRELPAELRPTLVFLGGSGGRLAEILDVVSETLLPGGKLLADFVALENLTLTLVHLRRLNWPVQVTEVSVARGDQLAGLTTLKPSRGVFILEATKPGADRD
jgi:precorrin-6Y C5,15-methyltransferase (decarboxylating) CbiT subunit